MGEAKHFEVFELKEVDEKGTAHGTNSEGKANQLDIIVRFLIEKEFDGHTVYDDSDAD